MSRDCSRNSKEPSGLEQREGTVVVREVVRDATGVA